MKQIEKDQILDLLDKPLEFLRLYKMFGDVGTFNKATNKIFTNPSEKKAFFRLTDSLHSNNVFLAKKDGDLIHKDGASFFYLPDAKKSYTYAGQNNIELLCYDINS